MTGAGHNKAWKPEVVIPALALCWNPGLFKYLNPPPKTCGGDGLLGFHIKRIAKMATQVFVFCCDGTRSGALETSAELRKRG
jgi:hypothetical protein